MACATPRAVASRARLAHMEDTEALRLGSEIRDARQRADLSQEAVANVIDAEVDVVAAIERGDLPMDGDVAERLRVALGLEAGRLWDVDVEIAVAAIGELLQMIPRDNRLVAVREILEKLRRETRPGQDPVG